jgi:hypothetical protein
MNNLLKITTKPIKISVQVERGKFVKVNQVVKLQNASSHKNRITTHKSQEPYIVQKIHSNESVQVLPKTIKLNENDNTIKTLIKQNFVQVDTKNVAYLSNYETSAKIEPLPSEINQTNNTELKFQPGDLNFVVNQYSEIEFEFVGDPIYTPASANPNKEK